MHHDGLYGRLGIVLDIDFLLRTLSTTDIIELHIVAFGIDIAQLHGIVSGEVDHLVDDHALDDQHQRLLCPLRIDAEELIEMPHLPCIIGDTNGKRLAGRNGREGIVGLGAAATGLHIGDS